MSSYVGLLTPLSSEEPVEIEEDPFDEVEDQFYESAGEGDDTNLQQDLGDKDDGDGNVVHIGEPEKKKREKEAKNKKIPKDKRTTTPFMTKYEKARILGTRSLQIR